MTVDLSYRDTGVCISQLDNDILTIKETHSLKNPKMGFGFDGLNEMSCYMDNTIKLLIDIKFLRAIDVVIVEMPCFTQDARSALCIGCCWGSVRRLEAVMVEPSLLKKWSGSKRGDGKTEVKNKVLERVIPSKGDASNDNIVDAIGLSLCFVDLINKL